MAYSCSVLIIDDEPVSAKIYARALNARGVITVVGESADEGLRMVKRYNPQLVISDVQMPGTDGIEFCAELDRGGLHAGPVMFFTGHDDLDVIRRGLRAGGDDFLAKGGALDEFLRRVYFWIATGFSGLPAEARERAVGYADALADNTKEPIAGSARLDQKLLKKLAKAAVKEVKAVSRSYGERKVERIYFLGRLSHLVLEQCTSLNAALRFPDYLVGATAFVEFPWISDLNVLLAEYDHFAADERFRAAAREGLKEVPA